MDVCKRVVVVNSWLADFNIIDFLTANCWLADLAGGCVLLLFLFFMNLKLKVE